MTTESTEELLFFPPLRDEVPVEHVLISDAGPPFCLHKDDDSSNNDDNMTSSSVATNHSPQTSPAMARFWDWCDKYDWANVNSSSDQLFAGVTEFVAASRDVIKFPDCQDVRRLIVPVFQIKAAEAKNDPRLIARAIIETYGLKNLEVGSSSSRSSSSPKLVAQERTKGKKDKTVAKKEKGKGAKVRNFTKEEDLFLSKAYVRVSLDPIRGNDQKSQEFWSHVYRVFFTIYKAEAEVQEEDMTGRTPDSVKSRFQRNIQKDILEFCAICRTNELKSGESQEDFFGRMDRLFEQKMNKSFRFQHCMGTLREIPKFDWETKENTNVDEVADDFLAVEEVRNTVDLVNTPKSNKKSSFVNNASTLKRPQGTKAAKRKVVEDYLDGKVEDKKMRILQDVATGLNDMAVAIQKKQHREHLQALLVIHQSLGNHDQVLSYLKQLEDLTAANPVERTSTPRSEERRAIDITETPDADADNTNKQDLSRELEKELERMNNDAEDGNEERPEKDDPSRELDKELERMIRESQ